MVKLKRVTWPAGVEGFPRLAQCDSRKPPEKRLPRLHSEECLASQFFFRSPSPTPIFFLLDYGLAGGLQGIARPGTGRTTRHYNTFGTKPLYPLYQSLKGFGTTDYTGFRPLGLNPVGSDSYRMFGLNKTLQWQQLKSLFQGLMGYMYVSCRRSAW